MTTDKLAAVTLSSEEGQCLVRLARATIAERLARPLPADETRRLEKDLSAQVFANPGGTFVTLKKAGHLRGCIGSLISTSSLVENVRRNALNAAFQDPRFPPLEKEELDQIRIEVSVLSPPEKLPYSDPENLLDLLRPGTDGVILRKGAASATFLPQVWQQLSRREDFLSHLCLKAGLAARAWREGDLEIETYQVQYFEEGRSEVAG